MVSSDGGALRQECRHLTDKSSQDAWQSPLAALKTRILYKALCENIGHTYNSPLGRMVDHVGLCCIVSSMKETKVFMSSSMLAT